MNDIALGDAWEGHRAAAGGACGASPSRALGQAGGLGGPCGSRALDKVRNVPPALATRFTPGRSGSLFAAARQVLAALTAP
jgi:hypothetical protein